MGPKLVPGRVFSTTYQHELRHYQQRTPGEGDELQKREQGTDE